MTPRELMCKKTSPNQSSKTYKTWSWFKNILPQLRNIKVSFLLMQNNSQTIAIFSSMVNCFGKVYKVLMKLFSYLLACHIQFSIWKIMLQLLKITSLLMPCQVRTKNIMHTKELKPFACYSLQH